MIFRSAGVFPRGAAINSLNDEQLSFKTMEFSNTRGWLGSLLCKRAASPFFFLLGLFYSIQGWGMSNLEK